MSWIHSQSRRRHCWKLQDQPFALCVWTWSFCSCVRRSGNQNLPKNEAFCLSRSPSQCLLQASSNRSRISSTLWWYVSVTQGRTRRLIRGLVKQTQHYMSFIAPGSRNRSFQTRTAFSFFAPILTCGHGSWVMTERLLSQVQAARLGFFAKSSWRDTSRQNAQLRWCRHVTKMKIGKASLHPRESDQISSKDHVTWLSLRHFAGSMVI